MVEWMKKQSNDNKRINHIELAFIHTLHPPPSVGKRCKSRLMTFWTNVEVFVFKKSSGWIDIEDSISAMILCFCLIFLGKNYFLWSRRVNDFYISSTFLLCCCKKFIALSIWNFRGRNLIHNFMPRLFLRYSCIQWN